jgi:WD40 repeat protein
LPDADGPYVGPRPFDRAERARFFGRDHEAQALASLVVAHPVVLLYAASGAGKTSLLNAGAIPLLEDDDGFEVLPTVRLQGLAEPEDEGNPYLRNLLTNLAREVGDESDHATLSGFLASRPHATPDDDLPAPRLLVIDQFEELFTLYPEHWPQRGEVFDALTEALEHDPLLRVVLSIREDFIAQLDPYAAQLRLRTRMRLEPLRRPAALAAIAQPLAGESRTFAPGVAEQLVDDLLKVRVHTLHDESVEVPGELVEPVQLQVVCRTLWSSLPPGVREIGEADLARIGSVSDVLSTYYSGAVRAAASAGGIAEYDLRERLEAAFVTAVGTRGTVVGAGERIAGMPAAAINELEARHLVRAEWRAGARWFELTHDSLIRPIVSSNAELRQQRQRRREKRLTGAIAGLVALAGILVAFLVFGRDEPPKQASQPPEVGVVEAKAPLAGLRLARELRASAAPVAIATTAGGRGLLAAGNDGRVRVWDLNLGREVTTLDYGDTGVSSVDIDSSGDVVAAGTMGLKQWVIDGLGTAEPSVLHDGAPFLADAGGDSPVTSAAMTPDGELLVVRDGRASLLASVDSPQPLFSRNLQSVAYSPSGTTVLGIGTDGTVRVRDMSRDEPAPTGRERVLQAPGDIVSASFSASGGQIVTASDDGTARVWHTQDGEMRAEIATGRAPLTAARLSPDGQLVATAGRDGMLRLFSRTGGRIAVVRAGLRPLTAVTWSTDGQLLITAGEDAAVRVWTNHAAVPPLPNLTCGSSYSLDLKSYVSASCEARAGNAVRAPEAGTISNDCGRAAPARVAIKTSGGRCWVFLGVAPHNRTGAVEAGAPVGEVVPRADHFEVELWESSERGRRISNLWDPQLFLDVKRPKVPPYPGDSALPEEIAQWMGAAAEEAGLPAELPVIAALTESGLKNLNFGDADRVGFFQMSTRLWNRGKYAGFPDVPDRQVGWFLDRAKAVRTRMTQQGGDPAGRPERYGEWAADVVLPAPQYRGRYQTKLADAQRLLDVPINATTQNLPLPASPGTADPAVAEPVAAVPADDP